MICTSPRVDLSLTAALVGLLGLGCAPTPAVSTPSEPRGEAIAVDAQGQPVTGHIGQDSPAARTRVGGTMAAPALHPAAAAEQALRERAGQASPDASVGRSERVTTPGESVEYTSPELLEMPAAIGECVSALQRRKPGAAGAIELHLDLEPGGSVREASARSYPSDAALNRCVDKAALGYRYAPLRPTDNPSVVQNIEFTAASPRPPQ